MNKRQSQFNKCVKIREKQYDWLHATLKQYKTLAGRLDFIINFYKNEKKKEEKEGVRPPRKDSVTGETGSLGNH